MTMKDLGWGLVYKYVEPVGWRGQLVHTFANGNTASSFV
jgi:hypothetical protein